MNEYLEFAAPPLFKLAEMSSRGVGGELAEYAKYLVAKALIGESSFTGGAAAGYVRKAFRTGAWRHLKPESRALLLALSKWRGVVRSPVLRGVLARIYLEIELHTTRGRALFYGVLVALKRGLYEALQNAKRLVTLGIGYMNLPPLWRTLG